MVNFPKWLHLEDHLEDQTLVWDHEMGSLTMKNINVVKQGNHVSYTGSMY